MNSRKRYICFENSCIEAEIATTSEERELGLMNRTNLPEYGGMLFTFDEKGVNKIWMKNMLISLDVIWFDDKGAIVHIDKNILPCNENCKHFGPESYTKFALEVNGGYVDRHGINIGDKVKMI